MGYMCHHAIIVTCWDRDRIKQAHAEATRLLGQVDTDATYGTESYNLVSSLVGEVMNGFWSFLVAPDGSKEGWPTSANGDTAREAFLAWLRSQDYADGGSPFDYAVVQFGDDDGDQRVMWASRVVKGPGGNLVAGDPRDAVSQP